MSKRLLRRFFVRLTATITRRRDEARLKEELEEHLALQTAANSRAGMPPEEAHRQAVLKFGAVEAVKENYRDGRSLRLVESLVHDLRYAVRGLYRNPAFTVIAVFTLSIGICATSAMFGVLNAVMLRPLPFPNAESLVRISESNPGLGRPTASVSYPNFLDWRARAHVFEAMAAIEGDSFTMASSAGAEIVRGRNVTSRFLTVLGVDPVIGRDFLPDEDQTGRPRTAIISHGFWQRHFGADRGALGADIRLDGDNYTIVGVLPVGFKWDNVDVFTTPLDADPVGSRGNHILTVIARLRKGVAIQDAERELMNIAEVLSDQFPASNRGWTVRFTSFDDWLVPQESRRALIVLFCAVAVVLLIASANVANLLLARVAGRHKEFLTRIALGAGRSRIVRQLLMESSVLALLAGLLGVVGSTALIRLLPLYAPEGLPRLDEVSIDLNVMLFACTASLASATLFGTLPALYLTRQTPAMALQDAARGSSAGQGQRGMRAILTVAEVALSVMLLIGAGLLLRSFWNLQRVNPGFESASVMTARIATEPRINRRVFYDRVLADIRALPGVREVATTTGVPLDGINTVTEVQLPGSSIESSANWRVISPGYFATMGIRLSGRDYSWTETPRTSIIVSQAMARALWPHQSAIGKTVILGSLGRGPRVVIGVAGDVRHIALDAEERWMVYFSTADTIFGEMQFVWRTSGGSATSVAAVRDTIRRVDSTAALYDVRALDQVVTNYLGPRRFNMYFLGVFASVAVALAAVGLFGIMAYLVAQRTREIGVRVALGAERTSILKLILGQGLALTLIGAGIGLIVAFWLSRVMGGLLFAVSARDPFTFAVVPLIMVLVAMVACYVPARRAARVDPLVALRYE